MSKKKIFSLSANTELPILHFLWRVKVASTSAIFLRFEADFRWKEFTAYKRLLILRKKGCLDTRSDDSGSFRVWTLTAKGFKAIQPNLLTLKEVGYASESVGHDLHVLAAHYGEWIPKGAAPDVRFVTEQELRRIDGVDLPRWARPLQSHKPDGIWYFPESNAKTLLALEVEISRKRANEYEALGVFYSEEKSISSVLWIVQSKGHASSMIAAFQATANSYRDIHNFVLLDDLKKSGWASVIALGPNAGSSIHNFLESARRNQSVTRPSPTHHHGYAEKMLNFHLKRFNSSTSSAARNSKFRA
ncbi:MAG: hypothetical protein AB7K68_06245 [Bacteriovoracia bacterium]